MVEFVSWEASQRKLRLFACALCRQVWHLLPDKRIRKAIVTAEEYADGTASKADLRKANHAVYEASCKAPIGKWTRAVPTLQDFGRSAVRVACEDRSEALRNCILHEVTFVLEAINNEFSFEPCHFVREIFGNPFRSGSVDPRWLSTDTINVAQAIYDDRSFDRLQILANRMQDRGCNYSDILEHCRKPSTHARGCWVIDLVLGKK